MLSKLPGKLVQNKNSQSLPLQGLRNLWRQESGICILKEVSKVILSWLGRPKISLQVDNSGSILQGL
jgi:hypothetical protein